MEALHQSLEDVREMCAAKMAEFQGNLDRAVSAGTSAPTVASLHADFLSFKKLILSTISCLQQQVEILARDCDRLEMQRRRKILLVEVAGEDTGSVFLDKVSGMKLSLSRDTLSRSQRMGRPSKEKPRPILVKFRRVEDRDRVWFGKSALKGTGITLSEFLTRGRHNTFLEARKRLGVSKSWTRNGVVVVVAPDGKQHRVTSLSELNMACGAGPSTSVQNTTETTSRDVAASGRVRRNRR